MNLALQKVMPEQVDALHAILEQCGLDMQTKFGLNHWIPAYPLHLMQRDAREKSIYAVREGERIIATFTVGMLPPSYGVPSIWQDPDARALYVNHLAVLPEYQGRGIGTWCMQIIEQLAMAEECAVVRLDVYDRHMKLHEFYCRLGYQERGTARIMTKLYGETGAVFFEKVVVPEI